MKKVLIIVGDASETRDSDHGFNGNVWFQYYAIGGDSRENLKRSIMAWEKLRLK